MSTQLPTFLYRAFNADGKLLYVGITGNVALRSKQHAAKAKWWGDSVDLQVTAYATRPEAANAERIVIETERPLYNAMHVPPVPNHTWWIGW